MRAVKKKWDYENLMPPELSQFEPYVDRPDHFTHCYDFLTFDGDWAEFGVWTGGSSRYLARDVPEGHVLWLFDSFEGLPEDWIQGENRILRKGLFDTKGLEYDFGPPDRIRVVKGWFEDTVADWAKKQTKPLAFIHIDSDLYSSCKTVLEGCKDLIVPGTVIVFDEIIGYENWREGEYKALQEVAFTWEWIGRTKFHQAGIRVT